MSIRPSLVLSALFAALLVSACAGTDKRQIAELKMELHAERVLLKETRAELQDVIDRVLPLLDKVAGTTAKPEAQSEGAGDVVLVSESEARISRSVLDTYLEDPEKVGKSARLVPSIKDGKANGFKLYAIRPGSLFAKLGLMNGDTIHAINGMDINSPDHALRVYTSVRDADKLVLSLTRRGKPRTHTITID